MCGYVEKGISMSSWEKRLAIITAHGDLIIYKEPLMGKIYELNKLKNMHIERLEGGEIIVRIQTIEGKKVRLRLTGPDCAAWAAKLINIRGDIVGHTTHPHVDYTEGYRARFGSGTLPTDSDASFASRPSESSGEDNVFVPSILGSAKFENPERARGGKVQGDVSEIIHSIMTSSSSNTSSNRRIIRKQVDELIKKHIKEEQQRNGSGLSPSAKVDAAFARLGNVDTVSHTGMHI
ncbi:hypothetical protein ANCCAN_16143 [Ancylostoma caninum]|uniref:PH-15 domain-containing protein n=1 Tax=Ancylostoma caninum TaxID=29170 RepID=A0A368G5P4_ANCCA|nr:hypothetical protein ANCCAN_16143 [Ancylostoma caninum]